MLFAASERVDKTCMLGQQGAAARVSIEYTAHICSITNAADKNHVASRSFRKHRRVRRRARNQVLGISRPRLHCCQWGPGRQLVHCAFWIQPHLACV